MIKCNLKIIIVPLVFGLFFSQNFAFSQEEHPNCDSFNPSQLYEHDPILSQLASRYYHSISGFGPILQSLQDVNIESLDKQNYIIYLTLSDILSSQDRSWSIYYQILLFQTFNSNTHCYCYGNTLLHQVTANYLHTCLVDISRLRCMPDKCSSPELEEMNDIASECEEALQHMISCLENILSYTDTLFDTDSSN